jgi:glycosyltransferase involved in cell wall biosynthesis
MKIAMVTSVHDALDVRIFYKECLALAQAGHEVVLIGPHEKDETNEGILIRALSRPRHRLDRMTRYLWRVYRLTIKEDADVYHFHDPEIIPVGLLLKLKGKCVIYDVHEDVPRQILNKHWILPVMRGLVSLLFEVIEISASVFFNGIIAATPTIAKRFPPYKTITVKNYPKAQEWIQSSLIPYKERGANVVYIGGIHHLRGAKEMVQAIGFIPDSLGARLRLVGFFTPPNLHEDLKKLSGWKKVEYLGWRNPNQVAAILGEARIGLVTLHPVSNYLVSLPVKLFEYMSAGIPVVASDFPLWRDIVKRAGCGLVVNPRDPREISAAIRWLLEHPAEAEAMGKLGQSEVIHHYNWDYEAEKLLNLYTKLFHHNEAN